MDGFTDNFDSALEMLTEQLAVGSIVWFVLFGILIILSGTYIVRGLYIHFKRSVESLNFLVFCIPVFLWSFFLLIGPLFGIQNGEGTLAGLAITCADFLIPTLLMLHIWSQVSYQPITPLVRILWLAAPIVLAVAEMIKTIQPEFEIITVRLLSEEVSLITFAASAYFIIIVVKSYLLCFNVFYQMPAHMRRSTYQMLIAITVITIVHAAASYFRLTTDITDVLLAVVYIIAMYALYTAFFIANAANVIVTSRDFVFSNLSTLVIVVSLKGSILDWNRKRKDESLLLPNPKYQEPFTKYRERVIKTCNGTISPHDENILNIQGEKGENNFLFTWHEIGHAGRNFGYLLEIANVTNVYDKLRYIEGIAYYDNLTLLHNRNAYIEYVKNISTAENMPLLIVIGDVNNLKKTNDQFGHLCGDKLLLVTTKIVKDHAPEGSFVARIGGDELVLLLPNSNEEQANSFINEVTETLQAINDPEIGTPSISWGFSVMRDTSYDYNDVFRDADAIMYEAKRKSRELSISGVVPPGYGEGSG